ncbi:MAG: PilZ domain-containing protein [Cyanobium sp.]
MASTMSADRAATFPELTRRLHARAMVAAARPLAMQPLDPDSQTLQSWTLVDILNISLGGLCLLVPHDGGQIFHPSRLVRLDVRCHPDFGVATLMGQIRWSLASDFVMTLGIGFESPLEVFPELLPCRRSHRRELESTQDWAAGT